MSQRKYKLHYKGSVLWLIFWAIVFFPIALTLLLTGASFKADQKIYSFQYDGSRFWLCFWVLVFFPVAFLLLFANGFSIALENENEVEIIV